MRDCWAVFVVFLSVCAVALLVTDFIDLVSSSTLALAEGRKGLEFGFDWKWSLAPFS